jgi:hypothetical protein
MNENKVSVMVLKIGESAPSIEVMRTELFLVEQEPGLYTIKKDRHGFSHREQKFNAQEARRLSINPKPKNNEREILYATLDVIKRYAGEGSREFGTHVFYSQEVAKVISEELKALGFIVNYSWLTDYSSGFLTVRW